MPDYVTDHPPAPDTLEEAARVEETRFRWRLLYSQFRQDVMALLARQIQQVRREAWGEPDVTAEIYSQMWEQVAVSYDTPPDVSYPAGGEPLGPIVEDAGLWSLMQRFQRDTLGMRENLMHVSVSGDGVVAYRTVRPDLVEAVADRWRRDEPVMVAEWRQESGVGWCRHVLSVANPNDPFYRVLDARGTDVTASVLAADFSGSAYPYRLADGTPVLPYVLYHAKRTGFLWDAFAYRGVATGTVNLCVLLTYYGHAVRNATWRQRYMVGVRPRGMSVEGADAPAPARHDVVADPSVVIQLDVEDGYSGQPLVGTWELPLDPEVLLRSMAMYERRILSAAGLAPADVTRQTADIRSGYSLAVARESVRAMQAKVEPQFERGDRALLALTAALHNRAVGGSLPESGYGISYTGVGESPADAALHRSMLRDDIAAGLLSPVDAYMELHPGMSRDDAILDLTRVARERALVAALGLPIVAEPQPGGMDAGT